MDVSEHEADEQKRIGEILEMLGMTPYNQGARMVADAADKYRTEKFLRRNKRK